MTAELLAFAAAGGGALTAADLIGRWIARRRAARPFAALSRAGRRLLPRRAPALADVELRLREAGRPDGLTARDLVAAKLAAALCASAAGLFAASVLPGRVALLTAALAPALGFFAPDVWLERRRRARVAAVRRDLPALLDLLAAVVAAGAPLPAALAEVGRRSHAPLARLWRGVAAEIAVGVPLADALTKHRREVPIAEVEAFTAAMARAARHGTPLGATLAAQAREARLARRRAVQLEAARAGPKMQLVVALLLVPAVMLLVAAALVGTLAPDAGALLSGY